MGVMSYLQLSIKTSNEELQEIVIAFLSSEGFESFQQNETELIAFAPEGSVSPEKIEALLPNLPSFPFEYKTDIISNKNWNKLWEQNYEPVIIENSCQVKAPFHNIGQGFETVIVIEPQMSFGTAHHESTYLMLKLMLDIDFSSKLVLDMGCGTGILAIMASVKGASGVVAIDNNVWAYNNSQYNIRLNNLSNIRVIEGDVHSVPVQVYDIIAANINRNVLLEDVPVYVKYLQNGGQLLISGFLAIDKDLIVNMLDGLRLKIARIEEKNSWIAMQLIKEYN